MKKLLFFISFTSFAFLADAQSASYKAFKVDVDFGYAIPSSGTGTKAGATFTLEPHYRLADDFAVGLRIEGAALGYQTATGSGSDVKVSLLTSYCATGEYYFADGGFRPFGGAGLGFFSQASLDVNSGSGNTLATIPGATKFGFFPRVGFESGHLRMSASYNILGNNSNYLAFTIGFFLGGGKK